MRSLNLLKNTELHPISIPTIVVFNKGELANQQVGAGSKEALEGLFKDLL